MQRRIAVGLAGVVLGLAGFAGDALAHTGLAVGGFASGLAHPILGADHVLAMIAVGVLAVQVAERTNRSQALWAIPGAFVSMMMAGAAAALSAWPLWGVEFGIVGSLIVLGLLVAAAPRLPMSAGVALAAFFAVFHGYAHGAELPDAASAVLYGSGFVISTLFLHGIGVGLGLVLQGPAFSWIIRGSGAAVAAFGAVLLVLPG